MGENKKSLFGLLVFVFLKTRSQTKTNKEVIRTYSSQRNLLTLRLLSVIRKIASVNCREIWTYFCQLQTLLFALWKVGTCPLIRLPSLKYHGQQGKCLDGESALMWVCGLPGCQGPPRMVLLQSLAFKVRLHEKLCGAVAYSVREQISGITWLGKIQAAKLEEIELILVSKRRVGSIPVLPTVL